MIRKSQPFEIKLADEKTGAFEGIASVYGNVDSYGDIVEPGAFTKTISERGANVPILWQHDSALPIGMGQVYDAGSHLGIKGQILDTVRHGADALQLIKAGVVKGLSIGYKTIKDEWDATRKVKLLKEIKLYEVSVVTFPANELAVLTGIKSQSEDEDAFELFRHYYSQLKAGRVLSAANMARLTSIVNELTALLADATAASTSTEPQKHSSDILAALREIREGR